MFKDTLSGFEGLATLVVGLGIGLVVLFTVIVPFVTKLLAGLAPLYNLVAG